MSVREKKVSRYKTNFEKPFQEFIRTQYGEHARRISSARRYARGALFTYPMMGLLIPGVPFGALTLAAAYLYQTNPSWFANIVPPETQTLVMPLMYALTAGTALLGMFTGVSLGLTRANQLIFDAERNELNVRQVYFLKKLLRNKSSLVAGLRTRGTSSYNRGSSGAPGDRSGAASNTPSGMGQAGDADPMGGYRQSAMGGNLHPESEVPSRRGTNPAQRGSASHRPSSPYLEDDEPGL